MKFNISIDYANNQKKYGKMSIMDEFGKNIIKKVSVIVPNKYFNKETDLNFEVNNLFNFSLSKLEENNCSVLLGSNSEEIFISKTNNELFVDENFFVCDSLSLFTDYLEENNIKDYELNIKLNKKRFLWFRKKVKIEINQYVKNFIEEVKEDFLKNRSKKILKLENELHLESYASDLEELEAVNLVLMYTHDHIDDFFKPKNLFSWFINSTNHNHNLEDLIINPLGLEIDLENYSLDIIKNHKYSVNIFRNESLIGNINYNFDTKKLIFKTITGEFGYIKTDNQKNISIQLFNKEKVSIVDFTLNSEKNLDNEYEFSLESIGLNNISLK